MKNVKWIFVVALLPFVVNAAKYEYQCESDADGAEGLCLAEPTDVKSELSAKNRKGSTVVESADTKRASVPISQKARIQFGATSDSVGDAAPGLSTKVQDANATLQAARAQEKIRQVETFLQNTKGPEGGLGTADQGPIKANQ